MSNYNNDNFKLIRKTEPGGDACCWYIVDILRDMTIREFINEVLKDEREWGTIHVMPRNWNHRSLALDEPKCEYRYGKLLSTLPEEELDKQIYAIDSYGGWSCMDYFIVPE